MILLLHYTANINTVVTDRLLNAIFIMNLTLSFVLALYNNNYFHFTALKSVPSITFDRSPTLSEYTRQLLRFEHHSNLCRRVDQTVE